MPFTCFIALFRAYGGKHPTPGPTAMNFGQRKHNAVNSLSA